MADDEEEEDYMSDAFLAKCESKDVRPGLLFNRGAKRQHDLIKQQAETNENRRKAYKPARVQEAENRDEGLNKKISEDNKGFQLLSKMGYKPGTSLGKAKAASSSKGDDDDDSSKAVDAGRIIEPIKVEIKNDRKGLGHPEEDRSKKKKKEVAEESYQKWKEELGKLSDPIAFRERALAAAHSKELERDLKKARLACEQLDSQQGITSPLQPWYWPPKPKPKIEADEEGLSKTVVEEGDEEEADELPPVVDMLEHVTGYLREKYCYCIWCGVNYENEDDLNSSCPGNSRQEH